jgi:xanthine dehydrogenase YagS FAD-binding subunit
VKVPEPQESTRGTYLKAMERRVWSFAQVSLAVHLIPDGSLVQDIRLVLSGAASSPRRLTGAENTLRGLPLNNSSIAQAAELPVSGAHPLQHNGYKISLIKGLVTEALTALSS